MPPWAPPVVIPLGYLLFWTALLWLIGAVSGWRTLAARYPLTEPFQGTVRRFQRVQLGGANYGGCVVGTNAAGLYLAVFILFRFGHPPIFVPWADVSAAFVKKWFSTRLELRFAAAPAVILRLSDRLGRKIAADANRAWAEEPAD